MSLAYFALSSLDILGALDKLSPDDRAANIRWIYAQQLATGGQLAAPEMSFWLTRQITNRNAPEDAPGGVFTLGGTNSSLFTGNIEFLNMPAATQPTFWLLQMSGMWMPSLVL